MFLGFGNRLSVKSAPPEVLVVSNSRLAALLDMLGGIIVIAIWYLFIGSYPAGIVNWLDNIRHSLSQTPIFGLFLLAPLLAVSYSLRTLRTLILGSRVTFNRDQRRIIVNNKDVASFHDVGQVRLSRVTRESRRRKSIHYELRLDLKGNNNRRIEIDTLGRPEEYRAVGEMIAAFIHADFVEKDNNSSLDD